MKKKLKWYSVLLLYPDYIAETFGLETYYAWVQARDSLDAVRKAKRQAGEHNSKVHGRQCAKDFHPLLVISGRRYGLPTGAE
jgi:hypothetical protein